MLSKGLIITGIVLLVLAAVGIRPHELLPLGLAAGMAAKLV
jgi:hypothetical protein